MARIECDHETVDGVTLVTCRLASDATVRVTVEPTHDEPIWPPRREGVPAPGWSDGTWTGVVDADDPRGLGYATPTALDDADDPVRIAAEDPTDADEDPVTARDVIRSLGDPSPARDAVPPADTVAGDGGEVRDAAGAGDSASTDDVELTTDSASTDDAAPTAAPAPTDGATDPPPDATRDPPNPQTGAEPVAGAARLDAIDERLATAATLADVSTPAEARAAVAEAGGIVAVRSLAEQLEADRAYLRQVHERTGDLAARAAEMTIPLAALERLA